MPTRRNFLQRDRCRPDAAQRRRAGPTGDPFDDPRPHPSQRPFHHPRPQQAPGDRRCDRRRKILAVGDEREVMALAGPETRVIDPQRPQRVARPLRQPHPRRARRSQLQHGTALGRRVRSLADAMDMLKRQVAITAAAMGARGWRFHRASICRKAPADNRGDQRGRARYPGLPATSL